MFEWDRVSITRTKQKAVVMFKTLNNQMPPRPPPYSQDMLSVRDFYFNMRRSENILHIPKPRPGYLNRSLGYTGAFLWNEVSSLTRLKKGINDLYYQRAATRRTRKPVL